MHRFKTLAYFLVCCSLMYSCSEYQKVLNKGATEEQYKMAVKMYETQNYDKAIRLFEKVTPSYRGKPQMERIEFMVAQSNFNEKNYSIAGFYFNRFTNNYTKSSKKEEAAFLAAYSYKLASPRFSIDPTETNKALDAFQSFINTYPNSDKIIEANKYYAEIRSKLEKKYFEIAKTYYKTADYDLRNYKAAIQAFDNLLEDFLGTKYKEEALYFQLKAAHDFVLKSTDRRKLERIESAVEAHERLQKSFPESIYMEDANAMLATLQTEKTRIDVIVAERETSENLLKQ